MLYAPPYLQKANALGYKTAKRRIAMELRDMITAILIVFAGEILQRFTKLKLIKMAGISSDHDYYNQLLFYLFQNFLFLILF